MGAARGNGKQGVGNRGWQCMERVYGGWSGDNGVGINMYTRTRHTGGKKPDPNPLRCRISIGCIAGCVALTN